MSGNGDRSSASCVDLLQRDFRAMMHYDYCQEKSVQKCFQGLEHCFGDQSTSKPMFSGGSPSRTEFQKCVIRSSKGSVC